MNISPSSRKRIRAAEIAAFADHVYESSESLYDFPVSNTEPPAEKREDSKPSARSSGVSVTGSGGDSSLSRYMLRCHPYCERCVGPVPSVAIIWQYGQCHQQWPVAVCERHYL